MVVAEEEAVVEEAEVVAVVEASRHCRALPRPRKPSAPHKRMRQPRPSIAPESVDRAGSSGSVSRALKRAMRALMASLAIAPLMSDLW